eukprot:2664509-Prymnesium_polylepis.1
MQAGRRMRQRVGMVGHYSFLNGLNGASCAQLHNLRCGESASYARLESSRCLWCPMSRAYGPTLSAIQAVRRCWGVVGELRGPQVRQWTTRVGDEAQSNLLADNKPRTCSKLSSAGAWRLRWLLVEGEAPRTKSRCILFPPYLPKRHVKRTRYELLMANQHSGAPFASDLGCQPRSWFRLFRCLT